MLATPNHLITLRIRKAIPVAIVSCVGADRAAAFENRHLRCAVVGIIRHFCA